MAAVTKAPRGTLDKLPSIAYKYRAVENIALEIANLSGYREIRTPVFEHTELFRRSVGDTTDIVQKEMYTFDDKKGRSLTLKPEGTAPVARAVIENGLLNEALPLKLCYITNCYRYEAPQSGRYREFSQFGAEVYGANTPLCDAELIALAFTLIERLQIPQSCYKIEVNSIGCPECRKIYQDALKKYYEQFKEELCHDCHTRLTNNPMRLLDCKVPTCAKFKNDAPLILEYNCDDCSDFFATFKMALETLNVPYHVNPKIVRGLDYYCNTVFEFVCENGLVFGGGGRYNGLMKELGGADTPASGFALGIERIVSVIEGYATSSDVQSTQNVPEMYIAGIGEQSAMLALKLSHELREEYGIQCLCDIVGRSVKAQMRFADKTGAKFSIVIGDDEIANNVATLKNMENKETLEVTLNASEISKNI
ncbi:MAG: histidine--tRNA ligase [Oscillospiraceae bacterium]|nr:histidine--tRNA ligase [Oscillospiraceae bacterium]